MKYFDMKLSHVDISLERVRDRDSVVQSWVGGNPGHSLTHCFSQGAK